MWVCLHVHGCVCAWVWVCEQVYVCVWVSVCEQVYVRILWYQWHERAHSISIVRVRAHVSLLSHVLSRVDKNRRGDPGMAGRTRQRLLQALLGAHRPASCAAAPPPRKRNSETKERSKKDSVFAADPNNFFRVKR